MLMLVKIGSYTEFVINGEDLGEVTALLGKCVHVERKGYNTPSIYEPCETPPEISISMIRPEQLITEDGGEATIARIKQLEKEATETGNRSYELRKEKDKAEGKLSSVLDILNSEKPGSQTKDQLAEMIRNAVSEGQSE